MSGTISREPTVGHVLCPELRGGVSVGIEGSGWDKDWGVCCCQTRLVGRGFGSACAWAELEWHLRWSQVPEAGKQDAVCCVGGGGGGQGGAQWAIVCSGLTVTPGLWASPSSLSPSHWALQIPRYVGDEFRVFCFWVPPCPVLT